MSYQGFLNQTALKRLIRGVDVPAGTLGIEWAEELSPINVKYQFGGQKMPTMPPVDKIEDATMNGNGNPVHLSQFPNTGYLGDTLGSV